MTKRTRKQPMIVEVHTMFEPHREAPHVLHQAYAFLLPITKRRLLLPASIETISPETQGHIGERKNAFTPQRPCGTGPFPFLLQWDEQDWKTFVSFLRRFADDALALTAHKKDGQL